MASSSPSSAVAHEPAIRAFLGTPVDPGGASRRGLSVAESAFDPEGFWGGRQHVNATATLAHCRDWMERLGWIANFDHVAAGGAIAVHAGWEFSDSEVYKLLEAMAWELARTGDSDVEAAYESLVTRVAAAQDDDGYLNTAFGHPGLPPRYSDMSMGHELYCTGHLLQAAVARRRTTAADDPLVEIARRAADHVCREFGAEGDPSICGHPEIEVALAEFGRAMGEPRYIEQARLFVERRGRGTLTVRPLLSAAYFQDDIPVREATALRGHAVRALYLSAGAVDVAVETGDHELFAAIERQWSRTVERRTYITGGMGSRHQDEGFGDDWELPPDRAYCETCAGVASVMLSWRLYLATGEVRYADLIERTLFNVIATSPSADGRAFFYANPLQQRTASEDVPGNDVHMRAEGGVRAPWFDVSCCPTNVARTLASLHAYAAAVEDDTLSLLQYAAGAVQAHLASGELALDVQTRYPEEGPIRVEIVRAPDAAVTLRLRVPHWAAGAMLTEPGGERRLVAPGWADVRAAFAPGDVVTLDLPMAPRLSWPDHRIDAVRGTVAVERGPLVLCLESSELPDGVALEQVLVDPTVPPVVAGDGASVRAVAVDDVAPAPGRPPFDSDRPAPSPGRAIDVRLVPYHRWAERGPGAMRVFLAVTTPEQNRADLA